MLTHTAKSLTILAFAVASTARADNRVYFQQQVLPIFHTHCIKCHGETKKQGKMSLHSVETIQQKWNADEHLLVPGKPDESELYERLTLPAKSPKRMPKEADPLPQAEIDLIRRWIEQGAVLSAAASAAETSDANRQEPTPGPPALPEVAAAPPEAIDSLESAGARVIPFYAGSTLLEVSFRGRAEPAGDTDIALLAAVGDQVYSLNLADAKMTDAGLAPLAALKKLSALHLERSAVGDDGLAHLGGLQQLQYLNLYGTNISDAGLTHLTGLKQLSRLYLWQTKVSYDAAMALEAAIPGLIVNLGFDHPVVARQRLVKELEQAKARAEEAQTALEAAKQRLEQSQKDADAVTARVAEIEQQLKEFPAPPEER